MNADQLKNLSVAVLISAQLLVPCLAAVAAPGEPWGPWSVSSDFPVLAAPPDRAAAVHREHEPSGIAATPFLWLLTFYQTTIGPVNSGRCPLHPTCSQYSVEAISKHGPAIGIVMTADRIIHELDEQRDAPLIKVWDRYRFHDPVRNNDFWWSAE